jgi:hypothetical protein
MAARGFSSFYRFEYVDYEKSLSANVVPPTGLLGCSMGKFKL